jgi:hypothetical protein
MAAGQITQGRRGDGLEVRPGDYWKEADGSWVLWIPGTHFIGLFGGTHSAHIVTEHEDGTISLQGSIIIPSSFYLSERWHGYLERGVWREV